VAKDDIGSGQSPGNGEPVADAGPAEATGPAPAQPAAQQPQQVGDAPADGGEQPAYASRSTPTPSAAQPPQAGSANPYGLPDQPSPPSPYINAPYGPARPFGMPSAFGAADPFRQYRPAPGHNAGGAEAGQPPAASAPGAGPASQPAAPGAAEPGAPGEYQPERYKPANPYAPDPFAAGAYGTSYPADPYGTPEDYDPADPYGPPDPYAPPAYGPAYVYGGTGPGPTGQGGPALLGPQAPQAPAQPETAAGTAGDAQAAPPPGTPPPPGYSGDPQVPVPPGGPQVPVPPGYPGGAPTPVPAGYPGGPQAAVPPGYPGGPQAAVPPGDAAGADQGYGPYAAPPPPGAAPSVPTVPGHPGHPGPPWALLDDNGGNNAASLTQEYLLPGRRRVPDPGWRRTVFQATGGMLRVPASNSEQHRRDMINRVRTPVAGGHHRVAVLSLKGGVGKTTTTVGLGATLASLRGDRIIAIDANPDRGTLSDKVHLETAATVRDLLNERGTISRYADVRAFTSQAPSRLEVLASDRDPAVSVAFSEEDYSLVVSVLEHYYSICLTDCGTGLLHSAMAGVLKLADQIVLVSTPSVDGARSASATLDWLAAHSYGDLVRDAVVVLSAVRPRSRSSVDLNRLEEHFASRCRAVIRVPYDPHLEEGAEVELDLLQHATADAYLELAAVIGDGLAIPARSRRS
jgi:MinD-like ATPase involved in chromosome partitioning or flagellar assembly